MIVDYAISGSGLDAPDFKRILEKSYEKKIGDHNNFKVDKDLSGKRVQVYHNPVNNQTIISHRGSEGIQDWITNARYGLFNDKSGSRFKHSAKISKLAQERYGNSDIIQIGHSLGSKLANTVAKPEQEILSYNGATTVYDRLSRPKKNVTHIRNQDDVVSALANENVINVKDKNQSKFNVLKNHSFSSLDQIKDTRVGK
jgi:hypothetical protein